MVNIEAIAAWTALALVAVLILFVVLRGRRRGPEAMIRRVQALADQAVGETKKKRKALVKRIQTIAARHYTRNPEDFESQVVINNNLRRIAY